MKSKTETCYWFVLRYYHPDKPNEFVYAKDHAHHRGGNRLWGLSPNFKEAYKFDNRSDARATIRTKSLREDVKKDTFWEVVKVVETKQVSYETEFIVSNAPPLYQLARFG